VTTVAFLVKNGIGFGHIRRACLLAEALQAAGRVRPVVLSQSHSLALQGRSPVQTVNLPLLHRLPSAVAEDWYTDALNRLLDRLDPDVVVEDTYPDDRHAALGSLADRTRLLVLRRLDGHSFDTIRRRGGFARYDEVLVLQNHAQFLAEGHTRESLDVAISTGRFRFVGNVYAVATPAEAAAARAAVDAGRVPLVVVSAGAGGDMQADGYGDRLFGACHEVARRLAAEGNPARFVLVVGPYYAGRPLTDGPNVTVRTFEPHLPALLRAADVAVIKPGNNALNETLAGSARLVLVPDMSFMEGVDGHAAVTVAEYGGTVATPQLTVLEPLIRAALDEPPREAHPPAPEESVGRIVDSIHDHVAAARTVPGVTAKALALELVVPQGLPASSAVVPPSLSQLVVDGTTCAADGADARRYLQADPRHPEFLHRRVSRLLADSALEQLVVDLRSLPSADVHRYLEVAARWLAAQPLDVLSAAELASRDARRHLEAR
jgi:hypothetical protein